VGGEASMGRFDLSRSDFSARFPNSSYDVSSTPDWSNLDLDGIDTSVDLKYQFSRRFFVRGAFQHVRSTTTIRTSTT
jgi:hypothetical protein